MSLLAPQIQDGDGQNAKVQFTNKWMMSQWLHPLFLYRVQNETVLIWQISDLKQKFSDQRKGVQENESQQTHRATFQLYFGHIFVCKKYWCLKPSSCPVLLLQCDTCDVPQRTKMGNHSLWPDHSRLSTAVRIKKISCQNRLRHRAACFKLQHQKTKTDFYKNRFNECSEKSSHCRRRLICSVNSARQIFPHRRNQTTA